MGPTEKTSRKHPKPSSHSHARSRSFVPSWLRKDSQSSFPVTLFRRPREAEEDREKFVMTHFPDRPQRVWSEGEGPSESECRRILEALWYHDAADPEDEEITDDRCRSGQDSSSRQSRPSGPEGHGRARRSHDDCHSDASSRITDVTELWDLAPGSLSSPASDAPGGGGRRYFTDSTGNYLPEQDVVQDVPGKSAEANTVKPDWVERSSGKYADDPSWATGNSNWPGESLDYPPSVDRTGPFSTSTVSDSVSGTTKLLSPLAACLPERPPSRTAEDVRAPTLPQPRNDGHYAEAYRYDVVSDGTGDVEDPKDTEDTDSLDRASERSVYGGDNDDAWDWLEDDWAAYYFDDANFAGSVETVQASQTAHQQTTLLSHRLQTDDAHDLDAHHISENRLGHQQTRLDDMAPPPPRRGPAFRPAEGQWTFRPWALVTSSLSPPPPPRASTRKVATLSTSISSLASGSGRTNQMPMVPRIGRPKIDSSPTHAVRPKSPPKSRCFPSHTRIRSDECPPPLRVYVSATGETMI